MDRRAWRATVHGVTQSQTRLKQLSTHTCCIFLGEFQWPVPKTLLGHYCQKKGAGPGHKSKKCAEQVAIEQNSRRDGGDGGLVTESCLTLRPRGL